MGSQTKPSVSTIHGIHPSISKKKWKRKSKKNLCRIPGHHQYQQWYQHWIGSKAQTCHESTAHGVELDNFWNPATKGWVKPRRNNKTVKWLVLYVCVCLLYVVYVYKCTRYINCNQLYTCCEMMYYQGIFLVPLIPGRQHISRVWAIYSIYISGI